MCAVLTLSRRPNCRCHCRVLGYDDGSVKVMVPNTDAADGDPAWKVKYSLKVQGAIKSISYDPLQQFIAVTTIQGGVFALDASTGSIAKSFRNGKEADSLSASMSTVEFPIVWHPTGAVLAYASSTGISVVKRGDWQLVYNLHADTPGDADGSCNGLAWSPNGRYLAATDMQRTLSIWDCTVASATDGSMPAVATVGYVKELLESEEDAELDGKRSMAARVTGLGWTAHGTALVVADSAGSLITVKTDHLERDGSGSTTKAVAAFAWPLGDTAAASSGTQDTTQAAGQAGNTLQASADDEEFLIATAAAAAEEAAEAAAAAATTQSRLKKRFVDTEAAESDAEEEEEDGNNKSRTKAAAASQADEDNVISPRDIKSGLGFIDDDEDGDGSESPDGISNGIRRREIIDRADRGGGYGGPAINTGEVVRKAVEKAVRAVEAGHGLVDPQPPFQSGSTAYSGPAKAGRAQRRYLVWNAHGAITSRKEALRTTVDVEFENSSAHRSEHMEDSCGYTMAAFNEEGAFFASPYQPPSGDEGSSATEDGQTATLYFKNFSTFGPTDWRLDLPVSDARRTKDTFDARPPKPTAGTRRTGDGEDDDSVDGGSEYGSIADEAGNEKGGIKDDVEAEPELDTSDAAESAVAVAIGEGWVAAATDRQMLRFIRTSGVQDAVMAVPGQVVSLAGRGALCAVAYHRTNPTGNKQHINVDLYCYTTIAPNSSNRMSTSLPQLLKTVDVPLRAGAHLQWFDFAANGMLLVHDTTGTMYTLQPGYNWAWTVLCDTNVAVAAETGAAGKPKRKSAASADILWPIAVNLAPESVLQKSSSGSSSSSSAPSCYPPNTMVPVLFGCILKGSSAALRGPAVSSPRPVVTPLPLHIPLLDTGDVSALDDSYIRAELMRIHKSWCDSVGISYAKGAVSIGWSSAMKAASMLSRGYDAVMANDDVRMQAEVAQHDDDIACVAIDKAVLRMIKDACDKGKDARAVQLACRLHLPKSFEMGSKLASRSGRGAVVERINQLMLLRQKEEQVQMDDEDGGAGSSSSARAALSSMPANNSGLPSVRTLPKSKPSAAADHDDRPSTAGPYAGSGIHGSLGSGMIVNNSVIPTHSSGINPFAKKSSAATAMLSPSRNKREREGIDALAGDSPYRGGGGAGGQVAKMARQSSFAVEARAAMGVGAPSSAVSAKLNGGNRLRALQG